MVMGRFLRRRRRPKILNRGLAKFAVWPDGSTGESSGRPGKGRQHGEHARPCQQTHVCSLSSLPRPLPKLPRSPSLNPPLPSILRRRWRLDFDAHPSCSGCGCTTSIRALYVVSCATHAVWFLDLAIFADVVGGRWVVQRGRGPDKSERRNGRCQRASG